MDLATTNYNHLVVALIQELKQKASVDKRDVSNATLTDTLPPHLEYTFKDNKLWVDVRKLVLQMYDVGGVKGDKAKVRCTCTFPSLLYNTDAYFSF